jgi:hypothetical protein
MMTGASDFRKQSRRCRELLKMAVLPDVREQLRVWAEEFEAGARCLSERARHSVKTPRHSPPRTARH